MGEALIPQLKLGDWQPIVSPFWEAATSCFIADLDILEIVNAYIQDHINLYDTPFKLVDSYRSYLIQVIKDIDYVISQSQENRPAIEEYKNASIDLTFDRAQPWRYTAPAVQSILINLNVEEFADKEPYQIWNAVKVRLDEAYQFGSLYRIDKYVKVAHVILDMAFDIGWDAKYAKASQIKNIEGLTGNLERAATLRETSLFIARNFYCRGHELAVSQMLLIGFPDISPVISTLNAKDTRRLLLDLTSQEAVNYLLQDQMNETTRNNSCNQIVRGALRVINVNSSA